MRLQAESTERRRPCTDCQFQKAVADYVSSEQLPHAY